MLLRVIFFVLFCYQAVYAGWNNSKKNAAELEQFAQYPSVGYAWTTLDQIVNSLIDVTDPTNSKNDQARAALNDMWTSVVRTLQNPVGAQSWIRISDHFKDTLMNAKAKDTIDKITNTFHLILRDSFKDMKEIYKALEEKDQIIEKLIKLKNLAMDEIKIINNSEEIKNSLSLIRTWIRKEMGNSMSPRLQAREKIQRSVVFKGMNALTRTKSKSST